MSVTISEFHGLAANWIASPGLAWCGDSFETGHVFREQIDTILQPLMSGELAAVLDGERVTISHPSIDVLRSNEDGAQVIALSAAEYAEFRSVVTKAIATADWGSYDTYEWDMLIADQTTGDYYVLIEFQ